MSGKFKGGGPRGGGGTFVNVFINAWGCRNLCKCVYQ